LSCWKAYGVIRCTKGSYQADSRYKLCGNDSEKGLGSRVDRHTHIGQGEIGKEPFAFFLKDERFKDVPGILETPKDKELKEDIMNLEILRSLL